MQREILRDLRAIGCSIKKHFDNSQIKKEFERVSGTHGWVILFLAENEGKDIYQRDLEKQFGISRSTTSKMLAHMEQEGLVGREKVASDDRLKKIVLTAKSKELALKASEDRMMAVRKLTKGFTKEELENLSDYLSRMRDNMKN